MKLKVNQRTQSRESTGKADKSVFRNTCIDDVLSINNPKFWDYIDYIYPVELEIKDTTDADHQGSYLDLDLIE